MNFPFYIARRYLLSKKSHNIINIIAGISVFGVGVGTMALIVILSVFNGFDSLITSLFNSFDPEIKITAAKGKYFSSTDEKLLRVYKMPEVAYYAEFVEENALLQYKDKQYIATVKGVSDSYTKVCGIDSMIINGNFVLKNNNLYYAVLGSGVSYKLTAGINAIQPITVHVPKKNANMQSLPEDAFESMQIIPSGVFSIQQDFDNKYIIVPLEFTNKLLGLSNQITGVEIKLTNCNKSKVQEKIKSILGNAYKVKNRFEQNELLYKVMNSEKWAIFFILTFILLIASFNILGSLTMLIIDKKNDIKILYGLGATIQDIKKIFVMEGWLISISGAVLGLTLGLILCLLQIHFGLIKLSSEGSFVVNSYPVALKAIDFVWVFATVLAIGFLASWYPVNYMAKKYFRNDEKL